MNELCRVALAVQTECERHGWRFCFIGGLAVQHWGEPRFTRDVDVTLLTVFGNEEAYIDPFLTAFAPRIDRCREFALQNRVLLPRLITALLCETSNQWETGKIDLNMEYQHLPAALSPLSLRKRIGAAQRHLPTRGLKCRCQPSGQSTLPYTEHLVCPRNGRPESRVWR